MKRYVFAFPLLLWLLVGCTAVTEPAAEIVTAVSTRTTQVAPLTITPTPPPIPTAVPLPTAPPPLQPTPSPLSNGWNDASWNNAPVLSADGHIVAFTSNGWLISETPDVRPWRLFTAFLFDRDTQQMELVSQTLTGGVPFDNIYQVALSGDGRVLAYYSFDGSITADDPDLCTAEDWAHPCEDLFIYDRQTGQTERIPRGRTSGLGADYTVALSADGRLVAYGEAGNLLLYDRDTGTAVPLLTTTDGQPPNGETLAPVMAANGDIAFVSKASNLVLDDTNETFDVFVWDSASGQVSRISQANDSPEANGMSGVMLTHEGLNPALDISADGRFIAFASAAASLTTEPVGEFHSYLWPDPRPWFNIYLHDRQTGETRLLTNGEGDSAAPTLSGDGRILGFATIATDLVDITACFEQLSAYCWQILLLDTQTGELTLVSRGLDGLPTVGNNWSPQLSDDGRTLVFASDAKGYTPDDTYSTSHIFLYDREIGQIERISVPNE